MARWFRRKQEETDPQPDSQNMFLALKKSAEELKPLINGILLHNQKEQEIEKGLSYIVSQADLDDKNIGIRKNSMAELITNSILEIQAELDGLKEISKAINQSKYGELLKQVDAQVKQNEDLHLNVREIRAADQTTDTRTALATATSKAEAEYTELVKELNTKIDSLKTLRAGSTTKLIETEQAHISLIINMLTSHLRELNRIKTELNEIKFKPGDEVKPETLAAVKTAKNDIIKMLGEYSGRTKLADFEALRTENEEIENNLKDLFTESGEIEYLEKQIKAKDKELTILLKQFYEQSINLVF